MYGSLIFDLCALVIYKVLDVVYKIIEIIHHYAKETTKSFRIFFQRCVQMMKNGLSYVHERAVNAIIRFRNYFLHSVQMMKNGLSYVHESVVNAIIRFRNYLLHFANLVKNGISYLREKAKKGIIKFRTYMLTDACMFYFGSILGMSGAWIAATVFESVLILAVANVFVGLFGSAIIILIHLVKLENNSLLIGKKLDIYKIMENHFYCLAVAGIGIHVASFIFDSSFTLNLFCVYMSVCLLLAACSKYPSRLAIYRTSLIPMVLIILSMIFGCVFIAGVYINSAAAMCGGCIFFAIFISASVLYTICKATETKKMHYLYQDKRLCCFSILLFGIMNIFAFSAGIEGAFKDTFTENKCLMRFFTCSTASIYFTPCFDRYWAEIFKLFRKVIREKTQKKVLQNTKGRGRQQVKRNKSFRMEIYHIEGKQP